MLKPVFMAACACVATLAAAKPVKLSGDDLRALIAGATIEIDAPFGNKIPVQFSLEGHLKGHAGSLSYYLGSTTDTGRWWVNGDQLCHKWTRWFSAAPQCLRVSKEGRTLHWLNQDGNSGTASVTVPAPIQTAAQKPASPAQVEPPRRVAAMAVPPRSADAPAPAASPVETRQPAAAPVPPLPQLPAANVDTDTPRLVAAPRPAVRVAAAPKPAAETQPEHDATRTGPPGFVVSNVHRDDVLNVRSGPSSDFDVVGELQPGTRGVAIVGDCRSEWCPVEHQAMKGWVNSTYLASETAPQLVNVSAPGPIALSERSMVDGATPVARGTRSSPALRDSPQAPRGCLTPSARALLGRIEQQFGPVQLVSTCRPGATIAGTGRISRHSSGNAIDFDAGGRKGAIIKWLIANHRDGGTMTYPNMDHIHVDIGPHFVAIAGGQHWASWRNNGRSTYRDASGED